PVTRMTRPLSNRLSRVDYALSVADIRKPARVQFVFDHEPIAIVCDVECELPARRNLLSRSEVETCVRCRLPQCIRRRGELFMSQESLLRSPGLVRLNRVH